MRIGCCTSWNRVEKLAAFGYDYIELSLSELTTLDESEFKNVEKRIEMSGIRCEAVNVFIPSSIKLTGPNVCQDEVDEYLQKALSRAGRLGVERIAFGSGGAKSIPDGFPREKGYEQLILQTRQISNFAEKYNVTVAIEPLRSAECNVINTYAEGCALAKDVGRDNIRVLVDYYHFAQEREPAQNIVDGAKYLAHAHIARVDGRLYPLALSEDEGYKIFFNALKQAGYDDRLSIEASASDFDADAPAALRFLRNQF